MDGRARPALLALLLAATGCATLTPRFDQAVTTSFARQPMRKLETARIELYYPEAKRDEALRLIQRLDRCVEQLRRNRFSSTERPKVLAYLTTANFDNAYVQPQAGGLPLQMVLAHHFTTEFFNLLEIGTNHVDDVSCHEATHYVQFQEVDELWYYLNLAFGDLLDPERLHRVVLPRGARDLLRGSPRAEHRASAQPHLARAVRVRGRDPQGGDPLRGSLLRPAGASPLRRQLPGGDALHRVARPPLRRGQALGPDRRAGAELDPGPRGLVPVHVGLRQGPRRAGGRVARVAPPLGAVARAPGVAEGPRTPTWVTSRGWLRPPTAPWPPSPPDGTPSPSSASTIPTARSASGARSPTSGRAARTSRPARCR